jgi:hypothetical protein
MALARGAIVIEIPVNGTASVYFKDSESGKGGESAAPGTASAAEKPPTSSAE